VIYKKKKGDLKKGFIPEAKIIKNPLINPSSSKNFPYNRIGLISGANEQIGYRAIPKK